MTGLYLREVFARRLIKRVLIVPPAGLIGNWEKELRTLFRLQFRIVRGADARTGNPFVGPESDRLVISMDTLAGERMTQGQMAERIGVSFATVNRWENGQSKPTRLAWQKILDLETAMTASAAKAGLVVAAAEAPVRFDFTAKPEVVGAVAEATRLAYGHLFNPAFATEISLIDPLPHQRIAVYEHMLTLARHRASKVSESSGAHACESNGLSGLSTLVSSPLGSGIVRMPRSACGGTPNPSAAGLHRADTSSLLSQALNFTFLTCCSDSSPFSI
jgi:transcriptional regulator with XRE-family HTH domain